MTIFLRRLAHLLRRPRVERELADELQFHRDMARQELESSGMSAEDAERLARRVMGDVTLAREESREVWMAPWLEGLWQDLRHGVASLRRSPGLLVVSALSVGLGIGLNILLFMVANMVYGHQPTMREPDRVIGVEPGNANQFSHPDYQDLVRSGIFADALGFGTAGLSLGSADAMRHVNVAVVTSNFFDLLGVEMSLGGTFPPGAAAPAREPRMAVVTYDFWQARLHGDARAVGETLILSERPFMVVGVLPEGYRSVFGWVGPQIYVPVSSFTLPTLAERGSPSLSVLGRLSPDGSAEQAQREVTALGAELERIHPDRDEGMGRPASVFPATALQFRGTPGPFFLVGGLVWASVSMVLVIACINVTGLLLARAVLRRREIAIRVALGAGRARVVQAMLVEAVLLVLSGAAVGLPGALVLSRLPLPGALGGLLEATRGFEASLLAYALALVVASTLVCGLVPALRATRADVVTEVRQGGEGGTSRLRFRHAMVAGQMAMSLVLVMLALLSARSELHASVADPGFDIDRGVVVRLGLDAKQYPGEARSRVGDRLVEQIEQLPGVSAVSVAGFVPLGGDALARSFHPAGRTDIRGPRPSTYSVGPGYFRTLGIPLRRGRDFDDRDAAGAPVVAIVDETFARTFFPGQDVIGRLVQTGGEPEAEVVGLVGDSRVDTMGESAKSVIYYAFAQRPGSLVVHVRTLPPPASMISTVTRAVEHVVPTVPASVETLRGATSLELSLRRAGTLVMGVIGAVGLLLAAIGLYGVMAYLAASRTVEVGIRMALGASVGRIRRDVLEQALLLVASGSVIGSAAVIGLAPAFRTVLVGIGPLDPLSLAAAVVLLAAAGLAAALLPAQRAARVEPLRALRHT